MYKKGAGNDKQGKDAGNRTLCPNRNFSRAIMKCICMFILPLFQASDQFHTPASKKRQKIDTCALTYQKFITCKAVALERCILARNPKEKIQMLLTVTVAKTSLRA